MPTFFLDWVGGNDANDGTTFANRWKTITAGATAARIAPGDTIRMMQSAAPTTLSSTLTWTSGNKTAVLTSALNLTISACESAWTASANVVDSSSATRKQGTVSRSLAIGATFATGIVAYFATGTLDCSGYQQICFWIRCNAAVAASTFRLDLCSDTVGAVPQNSVTITDAHQSGNWLKVVYNSGGALHSAIKSVSLVALLDPGTVTVLIDNIFVSKASGNADELTLHTLISKANGNGTAVGDVQWWPIMSIDGTTIEFDGGNSISSGSQRGYYGTTETVTTYARQPLVLSQVTAQATAAGGTVQDLGTAAAYITFSGGWDSTAMTTQPGATFLAVNNGFGSLINTNGKDYIAIDNLHLCGYAFAFSIDGIFPTLTDCGAYNIDSGPWSLTNATSMGSTLTRCVAMCSTLGGFNIGSATNGGHLFVSCSAFSNNAAAAGTIGGFQLNVGNCRFQSCVSYNNGSCGWFLGVGILDYDLLLSCLTNGNSIAAIKYAGYSAGNRYRARKCTFGEATKTSLNTNLYADLFLQSHDDGNVAGTHAIYGNGVTITNDSSTRHTASGYSWKVALSSAIRTSLFPVKFKLADMSLVANQTVTITAWVRRDTATSTAQLIWPGNQVTGVAADVTASASGSVNTWEQLTITFTPTEANVGTLFLYCSYTAGTPNIWVDDLSLSQP